MPLACAQDLIVGGDVRRVNFVQKFRVLRKDGSRKNRWLP
jgi:hypothetical protein